MDNSIDELVDLNFKNIAKQENALNIIKNGSGLFSRGIIRNEVLDKK